MKPYDFVILGAGISGVSFARMLSMAGVENYLILESEQEPGGLCRTKKIKGNYLDIGGGHFLCTKFPEVYNFIFSHLPKYKFNFFPRVSKVRILGTEIDYPVESNLWQLPDHLMKSFLESVVGNGEAQGLEPPYRFSDWIRWRLGSEIANHYMLPYNDKIWGVAAEEMDTDWLHKLPRLNTKEIIESCRLRRSPKGRMPSHEGFYYPKVGGFQTIFDAIYSALPKGKVCLGEGVQSLCRDRDVWAVNGQYSAKRIITTIPWPSLAKTMDIPDQIVSCVERLRWNQIVVSLWSRPYQTNAHWIYEPSLAVPHHREFMINNFAPHSDPNGMYTETNIKRWRKNSEALYEHVNAFAYPIPTLGRAQSIAAILEWAEKQNIYGLGRWGQWEYFNSDVCIREAMRLAQKLGIHWA